MADIRWLNDRVAVSPQITVTDLPAIAAAGIRSIVNNRPDGEAADQPAGADLQAAALECGLGWRDLPIVSGRMSLEDAKRFKAMLYEIEGPVLAFCRSGTRSCQLWALSQAGEADPDVILSAADAAGYDLEPLRPWLEKA